MTATLDPAASRLDVGLLEDIRAHAPALDGGEHRSRRSFTALGRPVCSASALRPTPTAGSRRWPR